MVAVSPEVEAAAPGNDTIPRLIKRNTVFLAIGQAVVGSTFQLSPVVGGLVILRMTGSLPLVGLTVGLSGLTRIIVSYPVGKLADTVGRRAAILLGNILIAIGAVLSFYSVVGNLLWLLLAGLVLLGFGQGAIHQMRMAAADMFPLSRKAEGVSYIMTGSAIGALGGPLIVASSTAFAAGSGLDPYATPWLFPPLLAAVSGLLVLFTRPDPLRVAQNLGKYYPGASSPASASRADSEMEGIGRFLHFYPVLVAVLVTSLTWGNMAMMMALVSVVLQHHGFDLTSISVSVAIHILGMYALSIPLGRSADRWGRRRILMAGSAISGLGALTTALFGVYWIITLGIFLVGLGWSAAVVTSTALVGDVSPPGTRGRILGIVEIGAGVSSLILPTVGGFIAGVWGYLALGLLGLLLSIPTVVAAGLLRESSPAVYGHTLTVLRPPSLRLLEKRHPGSAPG